MLKRTLWNASTVRMKIRPPTEASYANNVNVGRRPIPGSSGDAVSADGAGIGLRTDRASPSASSSTKPAASSERKEKAKAPLHRPARVGLFVRFHAWYLGVDPAVLARYGDGTQRGRYLKFLYVGLLATAFGAMQYSHTATGETRQRAQASMEDNRRRFYGHDFDQPMGEVSRNFDKKINGPEMGDLQIIVHTDERTGLLETADGRFIAPANYERAARKSPEITNEMMERVSNLARMQTGYVPKRDPNLDGNAPARLQ